MNEEVSIIQYYYGYTTEYILQHTRAWRQTQIKQAKRHVVYDKFWDLQTINLAREPHDQSSANRLNAEFSKIVANLRSELRLTGLNLEDTEEPDGELRILE